MLRPIMTLVFIAATAMPALAHEFWIDPLGWQVEPGQALAANIRVGQNMKGMALPYIPSDTRRFELITPKGAYAAGGQIGDRPALQMTAVDDGLHVVVHVTGDNKLTYSDFELFSGFVIHKDLAGTLESHQARDLPETGFSELYSRYAKALIAVGDGAGADRDLGLLTEITALANPYTDDLSDGFPVRLTYQGAPRADAQIEVFFRPIGGDVSAFMVRTDADGLARVPVKPGHVYMLDAVVMRPLEPEDDDGPFWESLWANLTFSVPATQASQ